MSLLKNYEAKGNFLFYSKTTFLYAKQAPACAVVPGTCPGNPSSLLVKQVHRQKPEFPQWPGGVLSSVSVP